MAYSSRWFAGQVNTSEASAEIVAPIVVELLHPGSVVDVGCGLGGWAAAFAKHGGAEVMGVDGDYVDRSMLRIPPDRFKPHDLTKPLDLGRTFDLAISLEVAEHLPESVADQFVATLTSLAPVVMFSAAVPAQGGNNHVNEQWQSYWVGKFAARGYAAADPIRPRVWDNPRVEWWYRQNTLLYFARSILQTRPDLRAMADRMAGQVVDVVHPDMLRQHTEAAARPVRTVLRRGLVRISRALRR